MKTSDMGKAAATVKKGFYPQVPGMMPMGGMGGMGMGMGIPGMGGMGGGFPGFGAPMRPPMGGPGMGGSFGPMGGGGFAGIATDEPTLKYEYETQINSLMQQAAAYGWSPAQVDQHKNAINTFYNRRLQNLRAIGQHHGKPGVTGGPQFNVQGQGQPPQFGGGHGPVPQFGGGWGQPAMSPFSPFGGGFSGPSSTPSAGGKYDSQLKELADQIEREQSRQHAIKKQTTPGIDDEQLQAMYRDLVDNHVKKVSGEGQNKTIRLETPQGLEEETPYDPGYTFGLSDEYVNRDSWKAYKAKLNTYQTALAARKKQRLAEQQAGQPAINSLSSLQARHAAMQAEADAQRKEEIATAKAERDRQQRYQDWMLQQSMNQGRQQQQWSPPAGSPNASQQPGYQMPPNIQGSAPPAPPAPPQQPRAAAPPQQSPVAPPANAQAMNLPKPPPPGPGMAPATPPGSGLKLASIASALVAAPAVGAAIGAGVGGTTAPQDYAPEGAARGAHTGLSAGLGAAGGGALGHLGGSAADKVNRLGGGRRSMLVNKGTMTGLGSLLGALAGTLWSHKRLDHKPWERGERPVLEKLDESMQIRRPAPGFFSGYTGPSSFFGKAGSDKEAGLMAGAERIGLIGSDPLTGAIMDDHSPVGGALKGTGRMLGGFAGGGVGMAAGAAAKSPAMVALLGLLGQMGGQNAVRQIQTPYKDKQASSGDDDDEKARRADSTLSGASRGGMIGSTAGTGLGALAALAANALVNRRAGLPALAAGRRHAFTGASLGAAAGLVGGATVGGVNGYSKQAGDTVGDLGAVGVLGGGLTAGAGFGAHHFGNQFLNKNFNLGFLGRAMGAGPMDVAVGHQAQEGALNSALSDAQRGSPWTQSKAVDEASKRLRNWHELNTPTGHDGPFSFANKRDASILGGRYGKTVGKAGLGGVGVGAALMALQQLMSSSKQAADMLNKVPNGMVDASKRKKKVRDGDQSLDGLDALMADLSRKPVVGKRRRSFQGALVGA